MTATIADMAGLLALANDPEKMREALAQIAEAQAALEKRQDEMKERGAALGLAEAEADRRAKARAEAVAAGEAEMQRRGAGLDAYARELTEKSAVINGKAAAVAAQNQAAQALVADQDAALRVRLVVHQQDKARLAAQRVEFEKNMALREAKAAAAERANVERDKALNDRERALADNERRRK